MMVRKRRNNSSVVEIIVKGEKIGGREHGEQNFQHPLRPAVFPKSIVHDGNSPV